MRRRIPLLFACALACCVLPAAAQRVDRSAWPRQSAPNRDYDALHYRIDLRVDVASRVFEGEARVTVKALTDGFETCVLDAERFEVLAVSDEEGRPLQFDRAPGRLAVHLSRRYTMGDQATFTVRYRSVSKQVDPTMRATRCSASRGDGMRLPRRSRFG